MTSSIWAATSRAPLSKTMRFPVDTSSSSTPGSVSAEDILTFAIGEVQGLTPNSTGAAAANTTALQAALTAGGMVSIDTPGTYYVNGPLLIPSFTILTAIPNVILRNSAGINSSVLRNANYASAAQDSDSYIYLNSIIFDGDKANQTVAFCTVDLQGVTHGGTTACQFNRALRTGTFPSVSTDGEGFNIRLCKDFHIARCYGELNAYDAFKTRQSYDCSFTDIMGKDNGRSTLQIAHYGSSSLAVSNPSERITAKGVACYSTTGIPDASSPTVSGVYFHGAKNCVVSDVTCYGVQNIVGFDDGAFNNSFVNFFGSVQNGQTALFVTPSNVVANTPRGNRVSKGSVVPLSGASQQHILISAGTQDNIFSDISCQVGAGSGTWTASIAGTNNQLHDISGDTMTITDTGTNTTFSNVQGFAGKINAQSGNYTFVSQDSQDNYMVNMTSASANTLIIAPDSTTNFPIGTELYAQQGGAGLTTVTAGAGVTINTVRTLVSAGQYAIFGVKKTAANVWTAFGALI